MSLLRNLLLFFTLCFVAGDCLGGIYISDFHHGIHSTESDNASDGYIERSPINLEFQNLLWLAEIEDTNEESNEKSVVQTDFFFFAGPVISNIPGRSFFQAVLDWENAIRLTSKLILYQVFLI